MVKKMKLPWPSCAIANPKTLSFRAQDNDKNMFKALSLSANYNISESSEPFGGDCIENVIRGLSSDRLFFEPRSSKLLKDNNGEEEKEKEEEEIDNGDNGDNNNGGDEESFVLLKGSVEMEIASRDPFVDFRRSMEEMLEAHYHPHNGEKLLQDWKFLEQLLACYLRINGKTNHGYIVGAFVDLLVGLSMNHHHQTSSSSPSSSSNEINEEEEVDEKIVACSSSSSTSSLALSSSFTSSSSNTYGHQCLVSSSSSSSYSYSTSSNSNGQSLTSPLMSFCSNCPTSPSLSLLEEEEVEDEILHEKSISSHYLV